MMSKEDKMLVEIWSDVMCPFCYIGKRRFEKALADSPGKEKIRIVWKSYQLSPEMKTDPATNIHQFLADHKGMGLEEAKRMNDQVSQVAALDGLAYNFDRAVVANSFNAHCLSHFAKQYDKQEEAEEKLFEAYFTLGRNIDDVGVLLEIAKEIGLDTAALRISLENGDFSEDVRKDIYEAQQIGVRGVPFFVFDRKYAISGAQAVDVFKQTIKGSYAEWQQEHPLNIP